MSANKPRINYASKKPWCDSHEPGHLVHFIQARVKDSEPRFDAEVQVLNDTQLRVSWLDESVVFNHHNTQGIQAALDAMVLNYVKFAPSADLLYIQTEEPDGLHNGVFSISFLARGELTHCSRRKGAISLASEDY